MTTSMELEKLVAQLQQTVQTLEDREAIRTLLDHYTALHDQAFTDLVARQKWENLFAEDAEVTYAFGTYSGRKGLGDWAWGPSVSTYAQCHLQSSNFDISIEGNTSVVRSNCITHWLYDRGVLDQHFDAGGVYQWKLIKEDRIWKIQKIDLKVAWTKGFDLAGVSKGEISQLPPDGGN
ncbi:hypothetical protein H2200_001981 [Cladophialophora chaetospira]|uniref:SnoaL-like domain-containing protein n=1 Tax=Cladophialophora chaetospira TaxID=386627 RepID=A0AA38XLX3_9EURO|nr:hypothetical protein H2200_001981 [Cladophialophora chaetospira]